MNEKKLFWDQEPQASFSFEPTDRFYFVDTNKSARTLDVFKREWLDVEGQGGREREIGITVEPPALNLSGMLSFHTKRDGEFLFHAFNSDGNLRLRYLRELARGGPMHTSELINMSAVNYYYSNYPIADLPPNLVLYKKAKQLYVYKNLSAWPYFYLAKELEIAPEENDHLTHVVRDTAYVPAQERLSLSTQAGSGKIGLTSFSYGQLMFDYESPVDELLVVADAWHPFWKARSEAQELKVIRANEVFKAVVLPAGKYDFRLFFDPSPYKVGIYISIVSWLFFFTALIWVTKKRIILGF